MSRIPSLALAITLVMLATGCASARERITNFDLPGIGIPGVFRTTIQQGNVITQEMVDRLKPGMSPRQVRFILGEPILGNTFRADRWDYIYTIQVGARDREQQRLTLWFEDDGLARFEGDFLPTALKEAVKTPDGEAPPVDNTTGRLPGQGDDTATPPPPRPELPDGPAGGTEPPRPQPIPDRG